MNPLLLGEEIKQNKSVRNEKGHRGPHDPDVMTGISVECGVSLQMLSVRLRWL